MVWQTLCPHCWVSVRDRCFLWKSTVAVVERTWQQWLGKPAAQAIEVLWKTGALAWSSQLQVCPNHWVFVRNGCSALNSTVVVVEKALHQWLRELSAQCFWEWQVLCLEVHSFSDWENLTTAVVGKTWCGNSSTVKKNWVAGALSLPYLKLDNWNFILVV